MNNIQEQTAAALAAALGVKPDSAEHATLTKFAAAFGQAAADKATEKGLRNKSLTANQVSAHVLELALVAGWTVNDTFTDTFAGIVVALVRGVQVVAPTDGINTIPPVQAQA